MTLERRVYVSTLHIFEWNIQYIDPSVIQWDLTVKTYKPMKLGIDGTRYTIGDQFTNFNLFSTLNKGTKIKFKV